MINERTSLPIGLRHSEQMVVALHHTVPQIEKDWLGFKDMPPVFATAMMVGFVEQTCIQALRPYLSEGQHTVGTHISMSHVAPTPIGRTVTAHIQLNKVDGRMLEFKVSCEDDRNIIGEGTHRRAIINIEKFISRLV